MNLKAILGWLALAFVVWWIIEQPSGAAHVVHNIGTFCTSAARGFSNFFASIGSGKSGTSTAGWVVLGIVGAIVVSLIALWITAAVKDRKK